MTSLGSMDAEAAAADITPARSASLSTPSTVMPDARPSEYAEIKAVAKEFRELADSHHIGKDTPTGVRTRNVMSAWQHSISKARVSRKPETITHALDEAVSSIENLTVLARFHKWVHQPHDRYCTEDGELFHSAITSDIIPKLSFVSERVQRSANSRCQATAGDAIDTRPKTSKRGEQDDEEPDSGEDWRRRSRKLRERKKWEAEEHRQRPIRRLSRMKESVSRVRSSSPSN